MSPEQFNPTERFMPLTGPDSMFTEPPVLDTAQVESLRRFSGMLAKMDKSDELFQEVFVSQSFRNVNRANKRKSLRRTGSDTPSTSISLMASTVALNCLIEDQAEDAPLIIEMEAQHVAQMLLPERFTSNIPNAEELHDTVLNYSTLRVIEVGDLLNIVSSEILPPTAAGKSPRQEAYDRYQLVKQFAYMAQQPEDHPAFTYGVALLLGSDVEAKTSGTDSQLQQSMRGLVGVEKEYYDFMFLDFLAYVAQLDPANVPREFTHTHNQIRLVREFNEGLPEPDLLNHMLFHTRLLPPSVRLEAEQQIKSFCDNASRFEARIRKTLKQYRLEIKDTHELSNDLIAQDSVLEVLSLPFVWAEPEEAEGEEVEDEEPETFERSVLRIIRKIPLEVETEPVREPYKLFYNNEAEPFDPADDQALPAALIKDLGPLVNVSGFISDLRSALKYLSEVDFTRGMIRGIRNYGVTLMVGGKKVDICGYKPADVHGLSMRTKTGKNIRMLFNFEGNKINIVKILQRDELNAFEANYGIGKARKK